MTTLTIHPGSPKTATSTLQYILRKNRQRLSAAGVGLILPEDLRGRPYLGDYLSAYRQENFEGIAQKTADFFGPVLDKYEHVICSEETFCHDYMPSRKYGAGGIDRSQAAAEILSSSGAEDTRIILSIRPQIDLLTSTYTHFVHRHREARDFSAWLKDEVVLENLLWRPAVQSFRHRFGPDAVKVVSLALVRECGMDRYIDDMLKALGIGHLGLEIFSDEVHNPSPSQRAVHLCRIMNAEIVNTDRSERINTYILNMFTTAEFGKFRPKESEIPVEMIRIFAEDHSLALDYP